MTPQEFVYWLQGFFEIAEPTGLDQRQIAIIKEHIGLVLKKETSPQKTTKEDEDLKKRALEDFKKAVERRDQTVVPTFTGPIC